MWTACGTPGGLKVRIRVGKEVRGTTACPKSRCRESASRGSGANETATTTGHSRHQRGDSCRAMGEPLALRSDTPPRAAPPKSIRFQLSFARTSTDLLVSRTLHRAIVPRWGKRLKAVLAALGLDCSHCGKKCRAVTADGGLPDRRADRPWRSPRHRPPESCKRFASNRPTPRRRGCSESEHEPVGRSSRAPERAENPVAGAANGTRNSDRPEVERSFARGTSRKPARGASPPFCSPCPAASTGPTSSRHPRRARAPARGADLCAFCQPRSSHGARARVSCDFRPANSGPPPGTWGMRSVLPD